MWFYKVIKMKNILFAVAIFANLSGGTVPQSIENIMNQPRYEHATWGLYVKDLQTGEILHDINGNKLLSPASTTKLFSVETLLNAFGDNYRFKTPIVATADIENGRLKGKLVLIAQGDLTMGGRQSDGDTISYTKLDHINANAVPGTILTKEDPLRAFNDLAKQLYEKGLRRVIGDVVIDDSLFEVTEKRGVMLSPIVVNENLIDIIIQPSSGGKNAKITWRPEVPGYSVEGQVKTVAKGEPSLVEISSDPSGQKITVTGSVAEGEDLVRVFPIKDPKHFARAALIQALQSQGIVLHLVPGKKNEEDYRKRSPLAEWTSPPLSEYAKLILKVSHNVGADLVPLLLASQKGKKTFDEGMRLIGDFLIQDVKLTPDEFVMIDAAGGNENRFTPKAEIQLLEYIHNQSPERFKRYFDALPILGVDGSLEDFAKHSNGAGMVRAKTGTGAAINLATGKFFLITEAYSGYIEGKNGHLYAYMVVVNNGKMDVIDDVLQNFEDLGQLSSLIYDETD